MRRAVEGVERPDDLMDYADAVREVGDGKTKSKTVSPFYFDARRSATALDIGFSPDVQNMSAVSFPAVESLGLIGLQRFRPLQGESRTFKYFAWRTPLPASVAAPAAAMGFAGGNCYSFTTASRGGDYLKMFTPSKLERSIHEQV
jgi:CRISPR-associated protein Csb3